MTTLAIELKSGKKHIVAASSRSTSCHLGAIARLKDPSVTCPNHLGCTADTDRLVGFSEYQGGHDVASTVASAGVKIVRCTTDGDPGLPKGIADAMKEADPTVCTERLSDITHFLQTQVKRAKKKEFSNGLFPGVRTKKMREQ
ncbi:hypothetical protein ACOMHN_000488 [Nucella lapillus]